jgi:hypothetical protein
MPAHLSMWSRFPELEATLPLALSKIIRKAAIDIQGRAMILAPRRTGFLRNSIYISMKDESSYGQKVEGADPGKRLLPEVERPNIITKAIVAVGAEYGLYIEMGSRFSPAHPFLIPAADYVVPKMKEALMQLQMYWREAGA